MSRQSLSGKVRLSPRLINIELLHKKLDVDKFLLFTEKKFLILFAYINQFCLIKSRNEKLSQKHYFF